VTVKEAVETFTAVPLANVVAEIEQVPVQVPFGIRNRNDTVCEVVRDRENSGIAGTSDCILLQLLGQRKLNDFNFLSW